MAWLRRRPLLLLAGLTLGCEAVLGADFGDYEQMPADGSLGTEGGYRDRTVPPGNGTGGTNGDGSGGSGFDGSGRGGSGGAEGGRGGTSVGGAAGSATDGSNDVPPRVDANVTEAGRNADGGDEASDGTAPPMRDGAFCTPGQVNQIGPCLNCGLYIQECNSEGTWDPFYCKEPPNACPPGSVEQRGCEGDGTQTATCNSSCTWTVGTCIHSTCTRNQVDEQPCGACGTQSRTCQQVDGGAWQWGPFSTCSMEKDCSPGTVELGTCGFCGNRSRVCSNACTWNAWGACENEGVCPPGGTETQNCEILLPILILGKKTRTCDSQCQWGPYGECKPLEPGL